MAKHKKDRNVFFVATGTTMGRPGYEFRPYRWRSVRAYTPADRRLNGLS